MQEENFVGIPDYTRMYGEDKFTGSLTPYIFDCFDPRVKSLILDGEMRAFNTETEMYEPFGNLKTASNDVQRLGASSKLRPCFHVFDILYVNGKSLVDRPLSDRYSLLPRFIKEKKNFIEILPHEEGRTVEDVTRLLDEHMIRCEEGLMIKNPLSYYTPSGRQDWLKIKPDYIDALGDDLDVVLVGGFFGEGRRGGKMSHFMCAIGEEPKGDAPKRLVTFCKFGTGFKMHEIESISRESEGHWKPYDRRKPPPWFLHPANGEAPDMILSPEHSRVIQLKGAEITKTDQYQVGWTLRFPRFVMTREDKAIEDALTVPQLQEYIRQNQGRMQTRRLQAVDLDVEKKKKRKVVHRKVATTLKVGADYLGIDVKGITKADNLFDGMEFCVLPGAGEGKDGDMEVEGVGLRDKKAVELAIVEHGGSVVQNPGEKTAMVIADLHTLKVSNLKQSGYFDVVKSRYILDCVSSKSLKALNPKYMIHTTKKTREAFKQNSDKWGDEYVEPLTEASLRELFNNMKEISDASHNPRKRRRASSTESAAGHIHPTNATITEIEERYFSMAPHEGSLFRRCVVYLDRFRHFRVESGFLSPDFRPPEGVDPVEPDEEILPIERLDDSWLDIAALKIRARGGIVVDAIAEGTTHIIVDKTLRHQGAERAGIARTFLTGYPKRYERGVHVVSDAWVDASIAHGSIVEERDFGPVAPASQRRSSS
ncbi:DNA ligase (ATP) [Borealophlyctis nickersoniae]|nr:DNA ligase (ATP) [Borealophlyctis nickersoniae]